MSPSHQVQLQPLFQLSMLSSLALHNICFCNMRSALPFKTENFSRMQNLETRSWFPIAGAKDLISWEETSLVATFACLAQFVTEWIVFFSTRKGFLKIVIDENRLGVGRGGSVSSDEWQKRGGWGAAHLIFDNVRGDKPSDVDSDWTNKCTF